MNKKSTSPELSGNISQKSVQGGRIALFAVAGLLFLISLIYFAGAGSGIFFLQEKQTLFIYSSEYLHEYLVKPGGMLEYAGNFLSQGYFSPIYGSLLVSASLLVFYGLWIRINKLLSNEDSFLCLGALIPSCLMLLLQTSEDHFFYHTIGYLLTFYYATLAVKPWSGRSKFLIPALLPLFFYIAGSFALLFLLFCLVYNLIFKKGWQRFQLPGIMILSAMLTFFVFEKILFFQPPARLINYPLNIFANPDSWTAGMGLNIYFVFSPLIIRIAGNLKITLRSYLILSASGPLVFLLITLLVLVLHYDPDHRKDLQLEKLFLRQDTDAVIELQEKDPSRSVTGQFLYNLALSEKGELCSRMFSGCQDHGLKSLLLPATPENRSRLICYYYTIGLINEAHHLAYESMVTEGVRPENIKMLIKTDLINGNYKIAEKNIRILQKTFHYRRWADKFETMINKPEVVNSDPDLADKIGMKPVRDFFISPDVEDNIDLLLMSNPDNKKAFEYKMAWLLLGKNYKAVMFQVKKMEEMNYKQIPLYIEEAMAIYKNRGEELPYLGGFDVSHETEERYNVFLKELREYGTGEKDAAEKSLKTRWGKTFWYYFEFK